MSSERLLISPNSISEAPPSVSPQRNNPFRTRVKQSIDDTYSAKNLSAFSQLSIKSEHLKPQTNMQVEQLSEQLGINTSNNVKNANFKNSENDTALGRVMTITPNKNNEKLLDEICVEVSNLSSEISKQCGDNTLELREDEHHITPEVQAQRKLNKICKLVRKECLTNKSLKACGKCITHVPFSAGKRSYTRHFPKYKTQKHKSRKFPKQCKSKMSKSRRR